MMKILKNQLEELCRIPSVSGFEDAMAELILSFIKDKVDRAERDTLGNVIAYKKGSGAHPQKLLLDAHMDQIGLMITKIEDNGILRFTAIGGINPLTVYGKGVWIFGKEETRGIIGMKPPHLISGGDKKPESLDELFIDAGFSKKGDARKCVAVGDSAVIDCYSDELLGDSYTSSGLDNKAGVLTLLSSAELLLSYRQYHDVCFLFTVQEEVGLRGAKVGGFSISPDASVVCDVTFADPGEKNISVMTGKGPVIGKGPNYYPPLVKMLKDIAKREDIPVQEEIEPRPGGTDAFYLQITKRGVYTAGLYIPLRYMHSPVEIIDARDIYRASKLMVHLAAQEDILGISG
jgi:endoglucanase